MPITIKEVISRNQLKEFIRFPHTLYARNKYWVPPLITHELATLDYKKNPAFDYCDAKYWLAYKNGKIAGRIAGIINHSYIEKWKNNYARFGWIDFVDDRSVSQALLSTVEQWAKGKGMTAVHGPLGFTDLDFEGMLVEGFDQPATIATLYNYPYYVEQVLEQNYAPDTHWLEFIIKVPEQFPERIKRIAGIVSQKLKLKVVRVAKPADILPYAKQIFNVINASYKDLYGVVPLTDKQVEYYTKLYFGFIRAEFISIIIDNQNKVIGFSITMPSMAIAFQKAKGHLLPFGFLHVLKAMRKNDRADLLLVGILPEFQKKGIDAILLKEMYDVYSRAGIKYAEAHPELESNTLIQAFWKHFESLQHKKRTCFIKQIN